MLSPWILYSCETLEGLVKCKWSNTVFLLTFLFLAVRFVNVPLWCTVLMEIKSICWVHYWYGMIGNWLLWIDYFPTQMIWFDCIIGTKNENVTLSLFYRQNCIICNSFILDLEWSQKTQVLEAWTSARNSWKVLEILKKREQMWGFQRGLWDAGIFIFPSGYHMKRHFNSISDHCVQPAVTWNTQLYELK